MVTITNGIKTFRVTSGAVKTYESMGFYRISDEEAEEINRVEQVMVNDSNEPVEERTNVRRVNSYEHVEEEKDEDVLFIEELLEKPLSQWTNEEVKSFVRIKGIDTSGAQKLSQVRGIIKAYLEEEQRNK